MELEFEQGSDAWKEARYEMVTATDVSRILGLDPACSKLKLFRQKIEHVDAADHVDLRSQKMMLLGRNFERTALLSWQSLYLKEGRGYLSSPGRRPRLFSHRIHSWLGGSPDWLFESDGLLVEIKTHWFPSPASAKPMMNVFDLPPKYYLQVQTYLEVLDYELAHLYSWTLSQGSHIFAVRRDRVLFQGVVLPELNAFHAKMEEFRDKPLTGEYLRALNREMRMTQVRKDELLDEVLRSISVHVQLVC